MRTILFILLSVSIASAQWKYDTIAVQSVTMFEGNVRVYDFEQEIYGSVVFEMTQSITAPVQFGETITEPVEFPEEPELFVLTSGTIIGGRGFRYVAIQTNDACRILSIKAVNRILDRTPVNAFESSDTLLQKIYDVGLNTLNLCAQNQYWDGIKRDRLVWAGDLFIEARSNYAVYGNDSLVHLSLNQLDANTPASAEINNIPSFTLWWILGSLECYEHDLDTTGLSRVWARLDTVLNWVNESGQWQWHGTSWQFVDWSTEGNINASKAGYQALLAMTLERAYAVARYVCPCSRVELYEHHLINVLSYQVNHYNKPIVAALIVLAGYGNASESLSFLRQNGLGGIVSGLGMYWVCEALSESGYASECMPIIKTWYGGQLILGATAFFEFWQDYYISLCGVGEVCDEGADLLKFVLGQGYIDGYMSLCHGWSSGVCEWLLMHGENL